MEFLYIEKKKKKMRCEWEKVETFMSMEMNYMGHGCEGTVKRGR